MKTGYFSDLMGSGGQTIFVRKKSQDYAVAQNPLYVFDEESGF